jgi:hypothetical protein
VLDVFSSGGPTASWFLARERKRLSEKHALDEEFKTVERAVASDMIKEL